MEIYTLQDFFEKFQISGEESFKNYRVEKVVMHRKQRKMDLHLRSDKIGLEDSLFLYLHELKEKLTLKKDIDLQLQYDGEKKDFDKILEDNHENLFFILKRNLPFCKNFLKRENISYKLKDHHVSIKIEEDLVADKARQRKVHRKIEAFFQETFDTQITCEILAPNKEFDLSHYNETLKVEEDSLAKELDAQEPPKASKNSGASAKEAATYRGPAGKGGNVILGKSIPLNTEIMKLSDIEEHHDKVTIDVEVFDFEYKELRSGKKVYILQTTDYSNSITVKFFEGKKMPVAPEEVINKGDTFWIRGDIVFDKFLKENVLMAGDINTVKKIVKGDTAKEKRVELHLHTQMSSMDGMTNISRMIKRAKEWGHKAIAVTDHGVLQAFPEAMGAAAEHDIKVIYGLEGYVVNDSEPLVQGQMSHSFDDDFVVFDLETTGLSSNIEGITEVAGVKIRGGEVIDTFSSLVNPEKTISPKITEITGITNDMVRGARTIDRVLPEFMDFAKGACLVAHNADFDMGFVRAKAKKLGLPVENSVADTLTLSRVLLKDLKRHKLNLVAKHLDVPLENHHRALDDAEATGKIFIKLMNLMKEQGIHTLGDINDHLAKKVDFKRSRSYHIVILAKNMVGLKNLYQLVSASHMDYFYKKPRIPKSLIRRHREGLILGTACEAGELYQSVLKNDPPEKMRAIVKEYDFLEVQPLENNRFLVDKGFLRSTGDLENINKRIIALGEKYEKPVVATGDVHFLNKEDEIYRRVLMTGQGFDDADKQPPLHFKTTGEMLSEFSYLSKEKAREIVIDNPAMLADSVESIKPIPDGTFPPEIEGSEENLRQMCHNKAIRIYGDPVPELVINRLNKELNSIISNGYAVLYVISQKLVTKSLEDGYLVGSRGSVGSSFAATMSDITEVNPLPPHYVCGSCQHSEFFTDGSYASGFDLPDKKCPKCQSELTKEGHDIPFEVFLGFEGDKEPDIDLNFAGEYQSKAHQYTEELFGKGKVFRAGTIGTIADKTAYGFVRKYLDEKEIISNRAEINRLVSGCTGVKRTSGQHPGGVMIVPKDKDIHDFCPIQYPANDSKSGVVTTHFDYNAISGRLLKLDILGHDGPTVIKMLEDLTGTDALKWALDDARVLSLFTGTKEINVDPKELGCPVGTLGIPEFGTKFVRQMLMDTKPTTFGELVRISGLSHGTDVWLNNAQDLVRNKVVELKDVISTRDDIMNYLILKGLPSKLSFKIMEKVRKGKGITDEEEAIMVENQVPDWYIDSCKKIKYMFPKAHAAAYVMMSFRIACYKVYHPEAFYATYFTTKAEDFDAGLVVKGVAPMKERIKAIESLGNDATAKEKNLLTVLEVSLEMYLRGIELLPVDLYNSDADRFQILEGKLLPPLKSLQGVGENAAKNIVAGRALGEFLSIQDLVQKTKVSKTVIEALKENRCILDLPETNQLSLF